MIAWKADVAIIGAGAAGLAAANALTAAGCDVAIVEARDRIGGRAFTVEAPNGDAAELGAEFIHGKPDEVLALVRATGASALETLPSMFEFRDGVLVESPDIWEMAQRVFRLVDPAAPDCSVDTFLDALTPSVADDVDKARIKMLIEGFDAARTADASVRALAQEWESETNSTASRPSSGYGRLFAQLAAPVQRKIRFGSVVEEIHCAQSVSVRGTRLGTPFEVLADHCIVTVPAGVLRAGAIRFEPELSVGVRTAIDCIVMGPVVKLVLDFDRPFWERAENGRFADAAFFRHPGPFQSFWTLLPKRVPRLIAWSGGGAVERLPSSDFNGHLACALTQLAQMFPQARPAEHLQAAFHHDWQADPFARGAYSYVRTGGADARERLGTPHGNMVIAGEATATRGDSGTVGGALRSGYRVARQIVDVRARK